MINSEVIKHNFSKYASDYDHYASIQRRCASRLLQELRGVDYERILDIGCGTGIYTALLRERFPAAEIKALDLSKKMVNTAWRKLKKAKIKFVIADAEKLKINQKFDLLTSNAAFQWFDDLEKTLLDYKKLLKEKGCILFSIFGPKTFYELKNSLGQMNSENNFITSSMFRGKSEVACFLKNNFAKSYLKEEVLEEESDNLGDLFKKIKYTGTRGRGLNQKGIWTKEKINNLEKIYRKSFGKIIASYQVFFVKVYN